MVEILAKKKQEQKPWGNTEEEGTSERGNHSGKAHRSLSKSLRPDVFWYSKFFGFRKVIQCIYMFYLPSRVYSRQYPGIKGISISLLKRTVTLKS